MTGAVATEAANGTRDAVAEAARLIARAGLVEGFGHVSARAGDSMLITPTTPLAAGADPGPDQSPPGLPLEWPLHAAVYRARGDVGAICRTHSAAAVAFGARSAVPPLLHGLGGLAGEVVAARDSDLVTSEGAADLLAAALGGADCMLLRGNGAFAVGATPGRATVRAWYLEERCRVAIDAGADAVPFTPGELVRRSRWYETETERAWRWLQSTYGGAGRARPEDREKRDGAPAPEGERG